MTRLSMSFGRKKVTAPTSVIPYEFHNDSAAGLEDGQHHELTAATIEHRREADAEKAFNLFVKMYEPKYPKAAICLQKDRVEMLSFHDFPAQHWHSIRTSNPIESTFRTIRHRTTRSKAASRVTACCA